MEFAVGLCFLIVSEAIPVVSATWLPTGGLNPIQSTTGNEEKLRAEETVFLREAHTSCYLIPNVQKTDTFK